MDKIVSFFDESLRLAVKHSPCGEEKPCDDDTLLCYEYEADGRYQKYYVPAVPKMIAGFLSKSDKRKMIANSWDYFILYAIGNEIRESKLEDSYMNALYAELAYYQSSFCDFDKLLAEYIGMEE